jgi:type I restriction enzyme, R subunit
LHNRCYWAAARVFAFAHRFQVLSACEAGRYVNNVIKGKLLESETLRQQAVNNTKEQFANSPDLKNELPNAIMGALDAHNSMSTQALNSDTVQRSIKDVLRNNAGLYESLRDKGAG